MLPKRGIEFLQKWMDLTSKLPQEQSVFPNSFCFLPISEDAFQIGGRGLAEAINCGRI
jgi:hypothetical protein